jgi:hypothetical protein
MPLLDDIGTAIANAGLTGGATGWTLCKSFEPATPDKTVTVYETGGAAPDQTPGEAHDFPTFQVRVRGAAMGYDAARTKLAAVYAALNDVTISNYVYVFSRGGAISLGYDENNRPRIVMNFGTMVKRV